MVHQCAMILPYRNDDATLARLREQLLWLYHHFCELDNKQTSLEEGATYNDLTLQITLMSP